MAENELFPQFSNHEEKILFEMRFCIFLKIRMTFEMKFLKELLNLV